MSNPLRGDAELKAGDKTYTIVFDVNAFCELEDDTGLDINGIVAAVNERPSVKLLRDLFTAGLQKHHQGTTKIEAGDIMSDAGVEALEQVLVKALVQALPPEAKGKTENPPARAKKK